MTKKVPVSVSKEWQAEIDELGNLMGLNPQIYGYLPQVLRFSITLALNSIKSLEEVIPDLKEAETAILFSSISKARQKRKLHEKATATAEMAAKV